jgi:hypothetical protein
MSTRTSILDSATSEFFVSRAEVIDAKPNPIVRIDGAHPLRLAALESVLTDGGIVKAVMWAARPDIDCGPRGPWITPLSAQLTEALARLSGTPTVGAAAERWMAVGTWDPGVDLRDELTVALLLLAHLARDAARLHGRVWCWSELPPDPEPRLWDRWRRRPTGVRRGFASDRRP